MIKPYNAVVEEGTGLLGGLMIRPKCPNCGYESQNTISIPKDKEFEARIFCRSCAKSYIAGMKDIVEDIESNTDVSPLNLDEKAIVVGAWEIGVPSDLVYTIDTNKLACGPGGDQYYFQMKSKANPDFEDVHDEIFSMFVSFAAQLVNTIPPLDYLSDDGASYVEEILNANGVLSSLQGESKLIKKTKDVLVFINESQLEARDDFSCFGFKVYVSGNPIQYMGQIDIGNDYLPKEEHRDFVIGLLNTVEKLDFTTYIPFDSKRKYSFEEGNTITLFDKISIDIPDNSIYSTDKNKINTTEGAARELLILPNNYDFIKDPLEAEYFVSVQSMPLASFDILYSKKIFSSLWGKLREELGNCMPGCILFGKNDDDLTVCYSLNVSTDENDLFGKAMGIIVTGEAEKTVLYFFNLLINFDSHKYSQYEAFADLAQMMNAFVSRISIGDDYVNNECVDDVLAKKSLFSSDIDEDNFYIEDGVLLEYNGNAKNIVLPNSICEIEESAFASSNIVSVVIPESVVKIGESAFSKCEKLEKVTLPSGLDKIPYGAFIHCKKLKEITIPSTVTELGEFAFGWCESLGEITIPGGVYKLGSANEDPFFGCDNLERVYIEDGVKELGSIFGCCGNIKDIYVPSSVKLIDETFYTHPNMVVHVVKGSYAESFFKEDEIVKEILFDYSISALKESDTSYDSSSLSKESEAESDTVILMGDYEVDSSGTLVAYNGCEESIVLPEGVIAIDPDAFLDYKEFVSVVFPEGFETICSYAFYECNLESIEIPNSVTVIGDGAFSHCASLKKVVIPNSITEINLNTFFACTSLTSIKIPDSVTRIGDSAFQGCTGLTSIEIPDSVTKFDINVFLGCDNVTVYSSSNSEAAKYCEKNGIKFVATDIPDEKEVTKYKCPKCGNLVVEGCSSCENCGTPFNWGAPAQTQVPQKPRYKCPTCGGVIEEGTPACPTCGQTFKW